MSETINKKPLGGPAYGSIPHLPCSKLGTGDWSIDPGQARILTEQCRDGDFIVVQEKIDGSCVSVANIGGDLVPLIRAGHHALSSPYPMHHLFANWLDENGSLFDWLSDGERVVGEWISQVHGTHYKIAPTGIPFVAFDIIRDRNRVLFGEFMQRVPNDLPRAITIHAASSALRVERALAILGTHGFHGATDPIEGAVWRCERDGQVEFMAKFVAHGKIAGEHLPIVSGKPEVWNWNPAFTSK